jgi:hypothetical protein
MKIIRAQATGTGFGLPGLRLVEGELIRASVWERCLFFTTILPDVMFDVMNYCKKIDPQYTLQVIIPNGFTSASFDVVLKGNNFKILCSRRLMRGWFPLNPFAADFGSNYDVIFSIAAEESFETPLLTMLKEKYMIFEV